MPACLVGPHRLRAAFVTGGAAAKSEGGKVCRAQPCQGSVDCAPRHAAGHSGFMVGVTPPGLTEQGSLTSMPAQRCHLQESESGVKCCLGLE